MKPTLSSRTEIAPLVAFGAHPDDIEFGCGGIIAKESRLGRPIHFIVCSRGESGSYGSPDLRVQEAEKAAEILGAAIEFIELDGDARLEIRATHSIKLAAILRRLKPSIILAPSVVELQHPDHWRLGRLVRDAARLARYGGIQEIRQLAPHTVDQLLFYAVTPEAEPVDIQPVFIDVSAAETVATWSAAMEAHGSQISARNYIELQMSRARVNGLRSGVGHAIAVFPNDPLVLDSLGALTRGARRF